MSFTMGVIAIAWKVAADIAKWAWPSVGGKIGRTMPSSEIISSKNLSSNEVVGVSASSSSTSMLVVLSVVMTGASVLHEPSCFLANEVLWRARSCTVPFFRTTIWMNAVVDRFRQTYNENTFRYIFVTYRAALHLRTLVHSASELSIRHFIDVWVSCMISESVLVIITSVSYVLSNQLTAVQYDFTVASFWRLWDSESKAMRALSAATGGCFRKKCNGQRSAPSCNPFLSHSSLKADRTRKVEIRSNESNIGTTSAPVDLCLVKRRLGQPCHHDETTCPPGGIFCSREISQSGCWWGGLPQAFYCSCVRIFCGYELPNQRSFRVLWSTLL